MRYLTLVLVLVAASCGGDDGQRSLTPTTPTAPRPISLAGAWSGTFESNYSPEAVVVDVTQAGTSITGTWSMTSGIRSNGNISGVLDGSSFTGIVTYSTRTNTCQGSFSGLASAESIRWSSPGFTGNCGLSSPGNPTSVRFVLQRR